MKQSPKRAIGIFDSGVGGLTVAHAIRTLLPGEELIYFGDTAHLPYGDKSRETIRYYSGEIADFLLEKNCKLIVIACNTASAYAYDAVLERVRDRVPVINVIDPVVSHVFKSGNIGRIGIIGTKGTINSRSYEQKLKEAEPSIQTVMRATPLFVPMIEEGFIFDDISNAIIRAYLSEGEISRIDTLILGCTHYPIIKNQIRKFYNFKVDIIDSAQVVANELRRVLQEKGLLSPGKTAGSSFYVSDYTDYFQKIASMFFEEDIWLEKIDFWK